MFLFVQSFRVRAAFAGAMSLGLLGATPAQAAIQIESRNGQVEISPFNIGYNEGFGVGTVGGLDPGDLVSSSTGQSSSDDILLNGLLHYGPDNFDRVNSGHYTASQDFTAGANTLGGRLEQSSSVAGTASPSVNVLNTLEVFFTVTQDTTADLSVLWDGALNVGTNDRVQLAIDRVDALGDVQGGVVSLYSEVLNQNSNGGNGMDFTIPVSLVANQRYRVFSRGEANSRGSQSSLIGYTLVVPEPASAALLSGGLLLLAARRRRG